MENPLISGIRTAILPKIGNDLAPAAARTCSPDRAPAQHTRPATRRSTPICAVAGLFGSYALNTASGPTIVLVSIALFAASLIGSHR